jgi:hypothetical protein
LIVGGHQPELFHAGVWFKNFYIDTLAKERRATGLHVIVDHDESKQDTLRVPKRVDTQRETQERELFQESIALPFRPTDGNRAPWAETRTRPSLDCERWEHVIRRAEAALASVGAECPILSARRDWLLDCVRQSSDYAEALSRFRQGIEQDHGVGNLEVMLSQLCQAPAFGRFVKLCLRQRKSLWTIYNQCRDEYRTRHRIRNPVQPVPELRETSDCVEMPFWLYRESTVLETGRRKLWHLSRGGRDFLTDSPDPAIRQLEREMPSEDAAWDVFWMGLKDQGICIRPRALMTTLYLRCFVADFFVHGIGGGIYDQLTDAILLRWLQVQPPIYMVASASLHLPMRPMAGLSSLDDAAEVHRQLQLLRSVPERFLDLQDSYQRELHSMHSQLLATIPPRGRKREWHRQISETKRQVERAVAEQYQIARLQKASLSKASQQQAIVCSREYSFVLFPEADITSRLRTLANSAVANLRQDGD